MLQVGAHLSNCRSVMQCSRLHRCPSVNRVQLRAVAIHKEYSKGGLQDKPPSNVLLATPEDIIIECLTLMRKGELSQLSPYIPQQLLAAPGAPVDLAGVPVHEQGPLARCAPFMDTAARRVLPGHLLRRARILSSLQLGGSCMLRVSLTACTGEELVLAWKLGLKQLPGMTHDAASTSDVQPQQEQQQQQQQQTSRAEQEGQPSYSSSSSSSQAASCWQLVSCERDRSADGEALPKGAHPRTSPELVVLAQLQALQQQDVVTAAGFNMLGRHASGSGWDAHLAAFRHLLSQPQYRMLSQHSSVELGSSALPSQRHFLQEVVLQNDGSSSGSNWGSSSSGGRSGGSRGVGGGSSSEVRFLWRLGMQADGCWMVRSIELL